MGRPVCPDGTAHSGTLYRDACMKSRVPSMLFDCEVEEAPARSKALDADALESVRAVRTLTCPPIFTLQVVADVKAALRLLQQMQQEQQQQQQHAEQASSPTSESPPLDSDDTCVELAQALSELGHNVSITHRLGGGVGGACLRNLRHSFLSYTPPPYPRRHDACMLPHSKLSSGSSSALACSAPMGSPLLARGIAPISTSGRNSDSSSSGGTRCIIDPCFREQFEIAHATPRYRAVLDAVPAAYIGPEDRMPSLIELLCSEMALAFKAQGVQLPPWRQAKSMLSKWQPRRSLEERVWPAGSPRSIGAGGSSGSGSSGGRGSSCGSGGSGRVIQEPQRRFVGGDFALVEVAPTPQAA